MGDSWAQIGLPYAPRPSTRPQFARFVLSHKLGECSANAGCGMCLRQQTVGLALPATGEGPRRPAPSLRSPCPPTTNPSHDSTGRTLRHLPNSTMRLSLVLTACLSRPHLTPWHLGSCPMRSCSSHLTSAYNYCVNSVLFSCLPFLFNFQSVLPQDTHTCLALDPRVRPTDPSRHK